MATLAGACSSGSDDSGASLGTIASTTTTVPATTTSSTAVASTVTTGPAPPAPAPANPEDQARALYEAWTRRDRAAAATLAEPGAVTTLFGRAWSAGDGWVFTECSGAAGSIICGWESPSGQLLLRVQGAAGDSPVTVSEVRFG